MIEIDCDLDRSYQPWVIGEGSSIELTDQEQPSAAGSVIREERSVEIVYQKQPSAAGSVAGEEWSSRLVSNGTTKGDMLASSHR